MDLLWILVTVTTGVLATLVYHLLNCLGKYLADTCNFGGNVHGDVMFLKVELQAMEAFLMKMSKVEEPDERDKCWMKDVQELSHDIHDTINDPTLLGDDKTARPKGFMTFIIRTMNILKCIKTRRKIHKKVNILQDQVIELGRRHARHKRHFHICKATSSSWFDLLETDFPGHLGELPQVMVKLLVNLLHKEYTLFKSVPHKIVFLKTELETIKANLLKMSQLDEPDEQDTYWMKEMQRLSHDIHDTINDPMLRVDDNPNKPKGLKGFMNLLNYFKTRRGILKVNKLEALVIEVLQRYARYKVDYNICKSTNARSMEHDVLEHILYGTSKPTTLSFELLKSITKNFSEDREIGRGGFGIVYKGILPNGIVAVKKIFSHQTIDEKLFNREVNSLLNVNHENVVRFLGFCACTEPSAMRIQELEKYVYAESRERLLCFEYISNGSLHKYITDELRGLDWHRRYQIIKQICDGLLYLHKEKRILHMDLKPGNILLDNNLVAKIADFGLSRDDEKSQTMDEIRCVTPGYCSPEYQFGGKMSNKSDMYSLGVIIIELVTGSKDIPNNSNVLRRWRHRWNKSLKETPWAYQQLQITKCIEIGLLCQENDPYRRPFIWDIWDVIHHIEETEGTFKQTSNADESDVKQIWPYWEDGMLGIEPLKLHFHFEINKQISCRLHLTNETTANIAFNIQPMSLMPYCMLPNKGIVRPLSSCTVDITLQPQSRPPWDMQRPRKLIVRSTKVTDGVTAEEVTSDMFNKVSSEVVDEVKLDVVFDMPV